MDEVSKVFRLPNFGNKFQITEALANRNPKWMGINDPGEPLMRMLSLCRFCQEIVVKGEDRPTEVRGPIQ